MPHPPLARQHVGRFIAWAVLLATIGAAAGKAQQVARVRATIEAVNGNNLSLTTRTGDKLTVSLAPNAAVVAIVPVRLEDIKPGSFIGTRGDAAARRHAARTRGARVPRKHAWHRRGLSAIRSAAAEHDDQRHRRCVDRDHPAAP